VDPHPGEHIMFEGHPSWRSILGFYIKGLLAAVVLGAIAYVASGGGLAAAVAGGLFALVVVVGLIKRIATTYSISNQRLNIRRGIIARHVQETRLDRVQNVNTNQGVLERILQVGTVDFDTAGSGDSDFAFAGVAQPEKVMAAVEAAQREAAAEPSNLGGAPSQDAPPPAGQAG
jgi:uncharacterized membrane protein YdbT with pleckstrin-like domain